MDGYNNSGVILKRNNEIDGLFSAVKQALCAATLGVALSGSVFAAEEADFDKKEMTEFINLLVKEDGFSRSDLEKMFAKAEYKTRIIELISKPAERRLTWGEYRNLFINDRRISQGVEFWKANKSLLNRPPKSMVLLLPLSSAFSASRPALVVTVAASAWWMHSPPLVLATHAAPSSSRKSCAHCSTGQTAGL